MAHAAVRSSRSCFSLRFQKHCSMPSKATQPSKRIPTEKGSNCSVFSIKAAVIMIGFTLLVAVLYLLYLSTWTIVIKHKFALLASAHLYTTSTYLLLLCVLVTTAAIVGLFAAAWVEHEKGLKLVSPHRTHAFGGPSMERWLLLDTCCVHSDACFRNSRGSSRL